MKVSGELNKPITLTLETMKELISIRTALNICLRYWHKEENVLINSHIEIVEEALKILREPNREHSQPT